MTMKTLPVFETRGLWKRGRVLSVEETAEPAEFIKPLHLVLADRLGVDILSGAYSPGDILPNEIESSTSLAISRGAYREAIRTLAAKGLVHSRTKRGTRVNDSSNWNILDADVLRWMFETEPNPDFVRDLFELRLITEPAAAECAAAKCTDEEIAKMQSALQVMKAETLNSALGRAADLEFHKVLLTAARNSALASLSNSIGAAISWSTSYKARHNALDRDSMPDHERVFVAIAERNPAEARWAMESLIRFAQADLQKIAARPSLAG